MGIKTKADGLAKKYGTRDPFAISEEMGFIVVLAPLVQMRGFQQCAKRRRFIYINNDLDEQQQRIVCAHELAHHLLHRGLNRIFMDHSTEIVTQKFENEANRFAVCLLYSDDELQPFLSHSIEQAAAYMGVTYDLARYRMNQVVPELWAKEWP